MTAPAAPPSRPTVAQLALGDFEHELATTRRVLERVPDAHWDYKPHPRSMSLGQLAAHLANIPRWGSLTLGGAEFDFGAPAPPRTLPATRDAVLAEFDAHAAEARAGLAGADDARLGGTYTVRNGERVVMALPRAAMLRGMVLSHMVHHRGQLSVYLRLLDVPVPSIYGPSADEGGM
jgi:uncharacterized damage-inducible protein DinB